MPTLVCLLCAMSARADASAQQLLDRVVARVDGYAITLTDTQAAVGLGVITLPPGATTLQPSGALDAAVQQMIDRRLILAEVERFPPDELDPKAVAAERAALERRVGAGLSSLMQATGVDDQRLQALARDNLRIRAYIAQRFGVALPSGEEDAREFFRLHPEAFMRNGVLMSFGDAAPAARERAGAARREAAIAQWLRDLRARADVVEPGKTTP